MKARPDHTPVAAALALATLLLAPGMAAALESHTVHWAFERVPYWELDGGKGAFGGYIEGSLDVVVTGDEVTFGSLYFGSPVSRGFSGPGAPPGEPGAAYHIAQVSHTSASVSFVGPPDFCDPGLGCIPKYSGGMGIAVDGDLAGPATRLAIIDGGFNFTEGHYSWWYGYFGPGAFMVREVPEPPTHALLAAGIAALWWQAHRRRR